MKNIVELFRPNFCLLKGGEKSGCRYSESQQQQQQQQQLWVYVQLPGS